MKIIISGGHLTPALAVIDHLQEQYPDITIEFVGRLYTQQHTKQVAHEKKEIESRNIPFHPFSAHRSTASTFLSKISSPIHFGVSFVRALWLVIKIKPDVFLSFGSYLSVPIGYACWVLKVPIVIHEQTRTIGRATKALVPFAKKIGISFPHLKKSLPIQKTHLTGNPIRKELLQKKIRKPSWIRQDVKKPMLYITGGSQGSEVINSTVSGCLKQLLKKFTVIHQCGSQTSKRNYRAELTTLRKKLPESMRHSYYIKEWISSSELSWILSKTACVVSRSGANTVSEIVAKKVPAIFIPLPFSINNEQYLNALPLQQKKAGVILEQKNLNPDSLIDAIKSTYEKRSTIIKNLESINYIHSAEEHIVQLVLEVIKPDK